MDHVGQAAVASECSTRQTEAGLGLEICITRSASTFRQIMSVSAHDFSPGEAHAKDNEERFYAIADTSSPGVEVFAHHHEDGNLYRGLAYPISKVVDPGDAESTKWHPGLTQAVMFHNPHCDHKVLQFCQQDDTLPPDTATELLQKLNEQSTEGAEIGLGSVVLAFVNARKYSIAVVRLARPLPKGKAVKSANFKPYKVEFISVKEKTAKKQVEMTKNHVKLMTLSSACLLGKDLVETFPCLSEAQIKVREAELEKAKVNGVINADSSTPMGANVSANTTDEANFMVSKEPVALVSKGKKRATSPIAQRASEQDSGAAPAAKRVKSIGGTPVSVQSMEQSIVATDDRMSINYLLNPDTESALGNVPDQQSNAAKVMPISDDNSENSPQDLATDKRLKANGVKTVSFALPDTSVAASQAVAETSTDDLPDTPDTTSTATDQAGQIVTTAQPPAMVAPKPRPVPGSLYFDQTYGCQFIEPYFRLPVIGMITELRDCTLSVAQFQQTFPTKAQAAEEINRYKRTYAYVVREGNAEKTKQAVPPPGTKSRERFWWTPRVNNFKWDCEAFEVITAAFEKYLNEAIAIYCGLCGKQYEEEKV
ncbi:hypothetical protein HII31_13508 [Pseudocercospora fuligena]|uniref:Uncharacterized protein n=1 Tax=Pseudocercospora fuligena TaxID=685502 RepID=A0A8H6VAN5_9PEZI|nr:hypothetical protein HII31_13508 [Pseudocercospora fuligena]